MRIREIISIFFAVFAVTESRVTFPFSTVVQGSGNPSDKNAAIDCPDGCTIYVNTGTIEGGILKGDGRAAFGNKIVNFKGIVGENPLEPQGYELPPAANAYIIQTSNYGGRTSNFVVYSVSRNAPNNETRVFVPQRDKDVVLDGNNRYTTILSQSSGLDFYKFCGTFPSGYPKIYATGYDVLGELFEGTSCVPVYQARSQINAEQSILTVKSPIVTVDFGYVGRHSVSVKESNGYKPHKSADSSTVYTSSGFVGCPFVYDELYDFQNSGFEDTFSMKADSFDMSVYYHGMKNPCKLKFRMNQNSYNVFSADPSFFNKSYGRGAFNVDLSWRGDCGKSPNVAIQIDFGTKQPISAKPRQVSHEDSHATSVSTSASDTARTTDPTSESDQRCDCCTKLQSELAEIRRTSTTTKAEGGFFTGWMWVAASAIIAILAFVWYRRRSNQYQ
ncbi:hypothetical protein PMAYCL1PPCAC_00914 [Pristionchus mayeri]|uniref:Uncharacterized protein n=1 Tax=Pristionchus mayeri TaxID=1317129 RepID=A0AAN4YZL1_9BILA|nr:hypothetical protein PMAYCL1PPCAC_00914 [Pristionchus mayeri]